MKRPALILALMLAAASPVQAEGDAAKGQKAFRICSACHTVDAATNRVGPYLKGVFGRKAGSVDGYSYSAAMKAKADGGLVWDETSLDAYLADPRGFVPSNKMAFVGVKKPDDRSDIIAYLKTKM
jgi:cytochrome c2